MTNTITTSGGSDLNEAKQKKSFIPNLTIKSKLIAGFTVVTAILAIAVGITVLDAGKQQDTIHLAKEVTVPIAFTAADVEREIVRTQADLHGWMASGNPAYKQDRQVTMQAMDKSVSALTALSSKWPPEKQAEWQRFVATLADFKAAQKRVEDIAHSADQRPDVTEFNTTMRPLIDQMAAMLATLAKNLNPENTLQENRTMLVDIVNVEATLLKSGSLLNSYLLSGSPVALSAFNKAAETLAVQLQRLEGNRDLVNRGQARLLDQNIDFMNKFNSFSSQIIAIRQSTKWDLAAYYLETDATPKAESLLTILRGHKQADGTHTAGLVSGERAILETNMTTVTNQSDSLVTLLWSLLAIGIVCSTAIAFFTSRAIVGPLKQLVEGVGNIAQGKRAVLPDPQKKDEIADVSRSLEMIVAQSEENLRTKTALDSCRTNVMVADTDYNIVYVNQTMIDMLHSNESDLRRDLPKFNAAGIIGTNIDTFHKNPAHQRQMLDGLRTTMEASLQVGGLDFDLVVSPIIDDAGHRIGTVVEWADVTEKLARERDERRVANENSRIKSALNNCTTNMMVADADYNIVYINTTMDEMLTRNDADMKKDLPQFDARKIVGANIDIFHKNPAHQRGMLDRLSSAFKTQIEIGGRHYNLIASPVVNDDGERIGTVVEWADITAERSIEVEIDNVVTAAVSGDFSTKLELEGKEGFMLKLSEAINSLSNTVSDAMEDVGQSLSALSDGNLTRRIEKEYAGLFDALKTNANNTADQLSEIVSDITAASSEVASAAQEINTGTMDLSQRTEQQASNLEETAAAMEEMASTVKQNAENAQQANQLSISARDVATKGGEVVGEVVDAMSRIEDSSQKISDIIGVIDEIAFQTNLLALNAAVEAARAGDAGKGFAVVAAEVGTLAQRSSQAAKDIKGLINDSGSQVKDGVQLVGNAGESLTEIVDSIRRLSDIVSEIAAASNEQSTSIEEINRSVSQMDEMTQQNSALVEQNAAASRTLQEQSEGMRDRVSFLQLEKAQGGRPTRKKVQARADAPAPAYQSAPTSSSMPIAKSASANGSSAAEDWSEF
jgi:methyl-accepting chemotaxis protein